MTAPMAVSGVVHAVLLLVAIVGLPGLSKPPEDSPAEVEILDASEIAKHSAAPKVAPPTPQDKNLPEKAEPAPPPPMRSPDPAAAAPPPPPPPTPKPPEQVAVQVPPPPPPPKPVEPPKPQPKPEPPRTTDAEPLKPAPVPPKPPEPKPEPPKPEPPKPAPPKPEPPKPEPPKPEPPKPPPKPPAPPPPPKPKAQTLDDILAANAQPAPKSPNVDRRTAPVGASDPNSKPNSVPARGPQTAAINSPRLTQSEEWGVISAIRPCWNPPLGAKDADKLQVEIAGSLGQDMKVISAEIVDRGRAASDGTFAAAANAALRAVLNPRCQPWPLPAEKYNTWKTFRFTFDPRFM